MGSGIASMLVSREEEAAPMNPVHVVMMRRRSIFRCDQVRALDEKSPRIELYRLRYFLLVRDDTIRRRSRRILHDRARWITGNTGMGRMRCEVLE